LDDFLIHNFQVTLAILELANQHPITRHSQWDKDRSSFMERQPAASRDDALNGDRERLSQAHATVDKEILLQTPCPPAFR
jgi:hypothetical protein